jgi:putative sugar O-methyltransferase
MVQRYMTPGRVIAEADYLAYVHTVSADLDLLFRMMPDLDIKNIHMPLAGNPYGVEVGGRFFYGPHFLYFAKKIYMLTGSDATRVVELGAGYGGLPWASRNCIPNSRYFEFDLPEVLAIASFYILSTYPKTNIALFGEVDLQSAELDNFDFIFMPKFEIERMPSNWSDVSFNSWSLAEMEAEAIGNYVRHLGRVTRRYFFHVNHVIHSKISSDVFPVNFRKFRLLHRALSMWGKSLHRNNFVDEHEFIYEVRS